MENRTATALAPLLAAGAVLLSTGGNDIAGRMDALSHQMMCTCGCSELLGECTHLGCPNSGPMKAQLQQDLIAGMSNRGILMAFQTQWGSQVIASPMFTRFNQSAWVLPPAVLIFGLLAALLILRRWRNNHEAAPPVARPTQAQADALARVRLETRDDTREETRKP
jgi:cytochrome c-type biogenesis protein CcmH/NrfF